jgi:hypothetical protein
VQNTSPTVFLKTGSSRPPDYVAIQVLLTPGFWLLAPLLKLPDLLIYPRLMFERRD